MNLEVSIIQKGGMLNLTGCRTTLIWTRLPFADTGWAAGVVLIASQVSRHQVIYDSHCVTTYSTSQIVMQASSWNLALLRLVHDSRELQRRRIQVRYLYFLKRGFWNRYGYIVLFCSYDDLQMVEAFRIEVDQTSRNVGGGGEEIAQPNLK